MNLILLNLTLALVDPSHSTSNPLPVYLGPIDGHEVSQNFRIYGRKKVISTDPFRVYARNLKKYQILFEFVYVFVGILSVGKMRGLSSQGIEGKA